MILLHDLVIIKEIKQEKKLDSGVIIPTTEDDKEYEVMEIGVKCKALQVGDRIKLYEQVRKMPFNDCYLINESKGIKVIL